MVSLAVARAYNSEDSALDLETRLQEVAREHNISFPLRPGYYPRFPLELLWVDPENARNSAVNIKHVKELANSIRKAGLIKPLLVDMEGKIPDGGHRDLAAISERAEYIPIFVSDFDSGARVSAASDSQVRYADYNVVMGVASAALDGIDVDDLVGVSNKKRDTINSYIRFGLNSTPELKNFILDKDMPLSHGISLARLNHQDQLYLLNKIRTEHKGKSSKDWIDTRVASFLDSYDKKLSVDELLEQNREKDIYEVAPNAQVLEKFIAGTKPTTTVDVLNFEGFCDFDRGDVSKRISELESKSMNIYSHLSKLYQLGLIRKKDLESAQKHIDPFIARRLLGINSLFKVIESYSKKHRLEKVLYDFDHAFREVHKGFEEGKEIKSKYDLEFVLKSPEEIIGSRSNVRGKLEETIESSKELIPSLKRVGLLQPVLAYVNEDGDTEVVCGNRRYHGFRQAREEEPNNEKLQDMPILLIKDKVSDADIKLLQIAEDSQRLFSPLEKGALYCQIRTQYSARGHSSKKALQLAIDDINESTGHGKSEIKRYMSYWQNMPSQIKDAYTHRLVTIEMMNGLIAGPNLNYAKKRTIIAKSLLSNRKSRKDILDFVSSENPIDSLFGNTNGEDLGLDIGRYIRKSLR